MSLFRKSFTAKRSRLRVLKFLFVCTCIEIVKWGVIVDIKTRLVNKRGQNLLAIGS